MNDDLERLEALYHDIIAAREEERKHEVPSLLTREWSPRKFKHHYPFSQLKFNEDANSWRKFRVLLNQL